MVIIGETVGVQPFRVHDLLLWQSDIIYSDRSRGAAQYLSLFYEGDLDRVDARRRLFGHFNIEPEAPPHTGEDERGIVG